ncbi:hypothetical protein [Pelosinus sp. UFO1]|uniref:hypothetical protein n=1 Tax=Pelosinus sp. UFO1 TaxID=484770 RepID=UPI0004D0DDE5|nr:hypothetical protein [Pelosinus sp. UFO1]AIF53530.1 hypothetical protein UFO1_3987 [Pelosinus sp. UFO1]
MQVPDVRGFDYELNQPDITAAKKLEEHYALFDIFKIRDTQLVTLILAAARTLAGKFGTMTNSEIDSALSYMKKQTRVQVIKHLRDAGWLQYNGVDFEMPDRARSLVHFMFTSLPRGDMSFSQSLRLDEHEAGSGSFYNLDEDEKENLYFLRLLSGLRNKCDDMQRILQKKDRRRIWKIFHEGQEIIAEVSRLRKNLKKSHLNIFSNSEKEFEIHTLLSQMIDLVSQIVRMGQELVSENSKSIGEFITPDMLDDYLRNASVELLSGLTRDTFASLKQVSQLREETIETKTLSLLNDQPEEIIEITPPPEIVDFIEEEFIIEKVKNPLELLYHEIAAKMRDVDCTALDELLFDHGDKFGIALYRTGQAVQLTHELSTIDGLGREWKFNMDVRDVFRQSIGPVEEMNDVSIFKDKRGE